MAGTGSLGVERFVVLVRGRGSPGGNFLLDLKEARASVLAPRALGPQPAWQDEGERVVEVQRWMQAISPALHQAVHLGDRPFTLRELQPAADRMVLENWNGKLRPPAEGQYGNDGAPRRLGAVAKRRVRGHRVWTSSSPSRRGRTGAWARAVCETTVPRSRRTGSSSSSPLSAHPAKGSPRAEKEP